MLPLRDGLFSCPRFLATRSSQIWKTEDYPLSGSHTSMYLFYLWLYSPLLGLDRFFSFLILYTVGRTPLTGNQPVARPLPTHRTTQPQNKCRQTCMPRVGFEPTTSVFERAKRVYALDSAATVIGFDVSS
jgi:hypothetical protein